MGFPGTWMTIERKRGLPRGAQMRLLDHRPDHVLLDNGAFFDGDIHDATDGHAQMGASRTASR
jgi:hypothetical protein